jgi:hypothetical protein
MSRGRMVLSRLTLAREPISTLTPSLRHAVPSLSAFGVVSNFRHIFAVEGAFEELFIRWMQGSISLDQFDCRTRRYAALEGCEIRKSFELVSRG